ncbi:MAG: DPP IV N-terminal domain-containing protein [Planctomycetes bacterium]|nr:DPP IV N-terminal domain-containing protein [Planctomycetota bacterium]
MARRSTPLASFLALALLVPELLPAQDRLKTMPGYARYQEVGQKIQGAFHAGSLAPEWSEDGKSLDYRKDGKRWRLDLATLASSEASKADAQGETRARPGKRGAAGGNRARGRQFDTALSPDEKLKAACRERNLWLSDADGKNEYAVTTDGDVQTRIKNATASWVYGEELDQTTAMWWSPDSKQVAFYRFDESKVPDFYLGMDQTGIQDTLDTEAYPKAGAPNPEVEILVYDLATKRTQVIDIRDGKPLEDSVVGHYAYNPSWTADSKELLFERTNRRQNVMELCAANPHTGKVRVVVHEEWLPSWTENHPELRFLEDNQRFVWVSERNGWRNFYLYDLSGKLLAPLTQHEYEVANIVKLDEPRKQLWYMARDGDNYMKLQLHRVGLDGKNDVRLTDPAFTHSCEVSPDGAHIVDVAQTHDTPPLTRLLDGSGKLVKELGSSDLSDCDKLGLKRVELFTFKAGDGTTELHGVLHFPSQFDASRKYPLLVSVYAGPATNGASERFTLPNSLTEYGFLYATLDSRSAAGRGKKFLDAIYLNLGVPEIDDQAAGAKALAERPYVDAKRVGIFGTSYGGYASALCLLRHPEVFAAACACSPVTDWRHYDTIYTERYMWKPQENEQGYEAGSAMTYADGLDGRLMLYFGTADNNVHPNNTLQLVQALQKAGKSFELQVGPDRGHSALSTDRMMEFFIEHLVLRRDS